VDSCTPYEIVIVLRSKTPNYEGLKRSTARLDLPASCFESGDREFEFRNRLHEPELPSFEVAHPNRSSHFPFAESSPSA
jgi:hypothetical protein